MLAICSRQQRLLCSSSAAEKQRSSFLPSLPPRPPPLLPIFHVPELTKPYRVRLAGSPPVIQRLEEQELGAEEGLRVSAAVDGEEDRDSVEGGDDRGVPPAPRRDGGGGGAREADGGAEGQLVVREQVNVVRRVSPMRGVGLWEGRSWGSIVLGCPCRLGVATYLSRVAAGFRSAAYYLVFFSWIALDLSSAPPAACGCRLYTCAVQTMMAI